MPSIAANAVTLRLGPLRPVDRIALATWAVAGGLVLYLGFEGGGYDVIVSSQIGLVLWWTVLVGAAWGLLPVTRLSRVAWAGLALFGGFVAWTALASSWSISSERSLQDLSRVATYLGVLLLALAIHRDRQRAVRHTANAIASAVVVLAAFALISRLVPGTFPAGDVTASFLGGDRGRLSWPLNYWNGLAALLALALPLLLAIATSARTVRAQAAAAGAVPVLALCGYLTFSRGGVIASAVAVGAFLALAPDRFPKLATTSVALMGSAVLIAGAGHRGAIVNGLSNHTATRQGAQLLVLIALVGAAVALAQTGIGLAQRHGTLPRWLRASRSTARGLLGLGVAAGLLAALAVGAPARLAHVWSEFKQEGSSVTQSTLTGHFSSVSGEGRYTLWKVAVHATSGHVIGGSGPGTFQLLWDPRAPFFSSVVNAHSLYTETVAEVGIVGLALLVGFFVLVLIVAVRGVVRSAPEGRTRAAAAAAALLAFVVSAGFDWVWQLPVLPAAFLLLAAAVLAPASVPVSVRKVAARSTPSEAGPGPHRRTLVVRGGLIAAAFACVIAIAVPLATAIGVRQSQAAASAGNPSAALAAARSAAGVEPGAAAPRLQLALVLEAQREFPMALAAARMATHDEPQNWSAWLVFARLQAEAGHAGPAIVAYRRARSLNPRSPIFRR